MNVAITPRIDTDPYANRSPEEVEKALREMGFRRIREWDYIRKENRKLKRNVITG